MNRLFKSIFLVALPCSLLAMAAMGGAGPKEVTFAKDVAPIIYNRCVECHRPGEAAPMSLVTYKDVRPWAKSIKEKVVNRSMPPWLAEPGHGNFENARHLTQKEIDTISAWADGGAIKGDDSQMPPLPRFEQGWTHGKPDVVIALDKEVPVPAEGVVDYQYFTVPTNFTEDRWVQAAEIRPSNRKVVHHIIVFVQEPKAGGQTSQPTGRADRGFKLAGYAPGEQPKVFPKGTAKLVKVGSNLVFQMHYTPTGEAATDRFIHRPLLRARAGKKTGAHRHGHQSLIRHTAQRREPRGEIKLDG